MKFSQRENYSNTEDGGSKVIRSVGKHLCFYMEIQATIQQFKVVDLKVIFICVVYLTSLPVIRII
jgi:hypothetical protein